MKKALSLIHSILANFKWYRKKKGGKWYKVYLLDSGAGIQGAIEYWTNTLELAELKILKIEDWPLKKEIKMINEVAESIMDNK